MDVVCAQSYERVCEVGGEGGQGRDGGWGGVEFMNSQGFGTGCLCITLPPPPFLSPSHTSPPLQNASFILNKSDNHPSFWISLTISLAVQKNKNRSLVKQTLPLKDLPSLTFFFSFHTVDHHCHLFHTVICYLWEGPLDIQWNKLFSKGLTIINSFVRLQISAVCSIQRLVWAKACCLLKW